MLELDLKPRDIMTRSAFENAMVIVMALGGSTNAVLHLIAMARSVDVPLNIDDFQAVNQPRRSPGSATDGAGSLTRQGIQTEVFF